ncbi:MAG: hypothetical protein HY264_09780 [Chloroflexi bacterium]|nr:hypothetical protein [Chloroflexota bacterium]
MFRKSGAASAAAPRIVHLDQDRPLVDAARRDPARFEDLYRRYVAPVYSFAYYELGNHHAAEDATARTFLSALANLEKFEERARPADGEGASTFKVWLFQIARNAIANERRTTRRHPALELDEATAAIVADPLDVEADAVRRDDASAAWRAVGRLPGDRRRALGCRRGRRPRHRPLSRLAARGARPGLVLAGRRRPGRPCGRDLGPAHVRDRHARRVRGRGRRRDAPRSRRPPRVRAAHAGPAPLPSLVPFRGAPRGPPRRSRRGDAPARGRWGRGLGPGRALPGAGAAAGLRPAGQRRGRRRRPRSIGLPAAAPHRRGDHGLGDQPRRRRLDGLASIAPERLGDGPRRAGRPRHAQPAGRGLAMRSRDSAAMPRPVSVLGLPSPMPLSHGTGLDHARRPGQFDRSGTGSSSQRSESMTQRHIGGRWVRHIGGRWVRHIGGRPSSWRGADDAPRTAG